MYDIKMFRKLDFLKIKTRKYFGVKKGCLDPQGRKYSAYPPFKGSCQMNYQSDIQSMVSKYSNYFYSSL
jgi:hypothetical protein